MSPLRFLPLIILALAVPSAAAVPLLEIEGPIGPTTAEYVSDALAEVRPERTPLVLLRIDTPGGLDTAMREIVRAILGAPVPVVAWVGPSGSRAASAGLFVAVAAHVAAMAPGTNLGAAHPVGLGGGEDETVARKAEQDAAAYIRSLAQQRGRDPAWFEAAVRESRSLSAEEALGAGVVDLLAPGVRELLEALDGREVTYGGRSMTLRTAGLEAEAVAMNWRQRSLRALSDPNVAYMLLILGFYGLFFELANPGSVFPGVLGGLFLILAFVGLQTLPFSYGGVLLILLGLVLLLLEVKVTSYGMLTVGGVLSLTLGSLMLFKTAETFHRLSWGVIVPVVAATVAFFAFAVGKGLSAQRSRRVSGAEGLVGEHGRALDALGPERRGKVFVHGEYWNATAESEVASGDDVRVVALQGLELRVEGVRSDRRG